ncbi:MAG: TlpA family protein disulfide reductase [Clostridium sp.]
MSEKKRVVIIIGVFIFIIGTSLIGYNYFSKSQKNNSIAKDEFLEQTNKDIIAPDFMAYDKEGNKVWLSDYKGKKNVVVNFWASWCTPCKIEMEYFQNATDKYNNKDVEILMVNLTDGRRETKEKANEFLESQGFDMNILYDSDFSAALAYGIQAIPRTVFINKDGKLVKDHTGVISESQLINMIDKLIK